MTATLSAANWWQLFVQFLMLSLLAVGGAITTAADIRYWVLRQDWLNEAQFTAAIALAQAALGPHVLFVTLRRVCSTCCASGSLRCTVLAPSPKKGPLNLLRVRIAALRGARSRA